jgi:transglutaminase-like putative cysteine protease
MKPIYFLGFYLISIISFAGDGKYPVSAIPEELRKDVNVVVRNDKMIHTTLSQSEATLYVYYAATIFNVKAKDYAVMEVGYDKLTRVKSFKGIVYDASGNVIKKLKSSDILDRSAFDNATLFSDARYKLADLSHGTYPYTVEFEYELEFKFLYSIQGTALVPDEKVSVQEVSYQLIYPTDLPPRYKLLNIEAAPVKTKTEKGQESISWTFKNLLPIKLEPYGPKAWETLPRILAAPSKFEYEGYAGDMSTWENYGKWKALVIKGRDNLPQTAKDKVKELTSNLNTTEEKAKVLYEYLQNKTRYVSIQLGIGGLQPFESSVVEKVGYGDCKALSNYMVAMLKEAGIKGYYTTVKAGDFRDDLIMDFPSHQSNHVVVAVPNGTDTLWLECTSQTNPFGYSGMFTGNRKAFMVTEDGGVWVNTPRYTANENVQSRKGEVIVKLTGEATAKVTTQYSGQQYENDNLNFLLNGQYDLQKKWVFENTSIPSFDLISFKLDDKKEKIPTATVQLELSLKRLATVSGKRLMLTPNLMNRNSFIPEKVENRKTDIVRNMGYTDIDVITYHVPEEIYPEFLPQAVKLTSPFGEFEAVYEIQQGKIVYTRKIKINKGRFKPELYNDFIEFFKSVSKADNQKIVFLNKT